MNKQLSFLAVCLLALQLGTAGRLSAQPTESPVITIEAIDASTVRLSWPVGAEGFTLEEADNLVPSLQWRLAGAPVTTQGVIAYTDLPLGVSDRFYRLRYTGAVSLTTLADTSPASGEVGVAVTRETVVDFSNPLSATTTLGPDQFYAEFGDRRILSRVALSSDRQRATLFYLEPLPGSARVRVVLDGDAVVDAFGNAVDADGDGEAGGVAAFDFETLSLTPVVDTAVVGRVFASELAPGAGPGTGGVNRPLAGVRITLDGREEDVWAVTDGNGNFKLEPVPAGRFFVHVDGRTAEGSVWPDGDYYPFIGKAWEAVAGRDDNLVNGTGAVFLPLIRAGTLQPVSETQATEVTFPDAVIDQNPDLAGVKITVPANSLFSDNGSRGGKVGIAPVPPDRLPEPLPAGLNLPLVITVQTDGASNFDQPVPVVFPNLPDPETGVLLPPGAKSALWSFDHDRGEWVVVGSATVSADGKSVVSDPGVGITSPGWHFVFPGVVGRYDRIILGWFTWAVIEVPGGRCPDGDPLCPANFITPRDMTPWTETGVAADGNYASQDDFKFEADLCYDGWSSSWRLRVRQFTSIGNVNLTQSGSTEPNPVDGGNVTQANYCDIIADMSDYVGASGGRGQWHTAAASRAHEYYHRDVDFANMIDPLWRTAEIQVESMQVACEIPRAAAEAILRARAGVIFATMKASFFRAYRAFVATHNSPPYDDGAYLEGMKELQKTIDAINAYATSKSWPACPALGGDPFGLFDHDPLLVELRVTPGESQLDGGQQVQLEVEGLNSDGEVSDLTLGSTGTTYASDNPAVASVSDGGLVTATGPGVAVVTARHFPAGIDRLPVMGVALVFVTDPTDRDGDFMPNDYEEANGLNPDLDDSKQDKDRDGLKNIEEFERGTDPQVVDTDGDGVSDGQEVLVGSDPMTDWVPEPGLETGLHYYALVNVETGRVEQRGVTGSNGIAHENLIMAPDTRYQQWVLQAATGLVGRSDFVSGANGRTFNMPAILLFPDTSGDSDEDGLGDDGEFVLGSNPMNPDTDGDGVFDGAELENGTNPLDGLAVATGVQASVDTPGNAVDVCAVDDLAIVADSEAGVSIFNIFSGLNPTIIGQVNTPGIAQAVSCNGTFSAVADGPAGLAVIDFSDPAAAFIVHQVALGSDARAVVAAGPIAFVGLGNGQVVSVDMLTGSVLDRISLGATVQDLALGPETIYVLAGARLHSLPLLGGQLVVASTVDSPSSAGTGPFRSRLFVAGDRIFATYPSGYHIFDLANVEQPVLVTTISTLQRGWKQIVANGSGFGLAALGAGGSAGGAHDVSLYDLGPDGTGDQFVAEFRTTGTATALAIYRGVAYVADGESGLQVINYLAYDSGRQPPSIGAIRAGGEIEEGKVLNLRFDVTDDVQVRDVELFINGQSVGTDGNAPFGFWILTPLLGDGVSGFTARATATDTGGNSASTGEMVFTLVPDATPPRVIRQLPINSGIAGAVDTLTAYFSEGIDPATLSGETFVVVSAGEDRILNTADDVAVPVGTLSLRDSINAVFMVYPTDLAPGLYQATLGPDILDWAGNPMAGPAFWTFRVFSMADADLDGVPDELEPILGLDPNNSDTDGNGVPDGFEDFDGDGLINAGEIILGTDATDSDTDDDGIPDGDEDPDGDFLSNGEEALLGTDPLLADSDGDGWNDEAEQAAGSNPLDVNSVPTFQIVGRPALAAMVTGFAGDAASRFGVVVGAPPVQVTAVATSTDAGVARLSTVIGLPSVKVTAAAFDPSSAVQGTVVGFPPVQVTHTSFSDSDSGLKGVTVAQPPVNVVLEGN